MKKLTIVEASTGKAANGRKHIQFRFDSGCWMIRYEGGEEHFHQKNNYFCREGSAMIAAMKEAVAANRRAVLA